mmetsp:Transcript_9076/g.13507  ORF Transcript_9076/g.13507 Transcript_9076/m.13507 type:complete len:106 (-) Transcript_9076:97-414(-)
MSVRKLSTRKSWLIATIAMSLVYKPEHAPPRLARDHMPFKHDTFKHDAKPQHVQQPQPQKPVDASNNDDPPHPKTKPLEGPGNYPTLQEVLPLAMPNIEIRVARC